MALAAANARNLVDWLDGLFPPRQEAQNRQRREAQAEELVAAFAKTDARETDIHGFVIQWRRAYDDSEDERIRTLTRPSGWDLRRLYDQARHVAQTKAPSKSCGDCNDTGRRVGMAVVWSLGLLRVEAIVLLCPCGQARARMLGDLPQLETAREWRARIATGSARYQGAPMVLVVDESPVFQDVVLENLVGLTIGEAIEPERADEIELLVCRVRDSGGHWRSGDV